MADRPTSAREAAVQIVVGVTEQALSLSDQMSAGVLSTLSPSERARAQRLATVTLAHLSSADAVLKPFLRKGPPAYVRGILRVAVVELLELGGDPHGVVGAAVDLCRRPGRKSDGFSGLVNAVLRKVAVLQPGDWTKLPPQQLPGWLRGRLMSAYGKVRVMAMEQSHAAGAPIDLTPADGRADVLAAQVGGTVLPFGSVRLPDRAQVSDLPGFAEGAFWVQDAAAAMPARALAASSGERVLDLCAAPGGKTLQLAAAGASVTALDLSGPRMARVRENLARCGLSAETVVADALNWEPPAPFDAILLDAPCSATGTIRRHPDLPFIRDPSGIKALVALQSALLDRALGMLRPGGRLVYSTCSLLPEEGETQVRRALERNHGLSIDPAAVALPGVDPEWMTPEGGLRLCPDYWGDRGGMDGFYLAVFRTPG